MLLSLRTSVPAILSPYCVPPATPGRAVPSSESLPRVQAPFLPHGLWAGLQAGPHSPLIMCDPHNNFSTRKFHVAESL